jgi:hypothetical protein
VPPDLSVEARIRGSDWLYNYFLAFYRDDKTTTGWNNLVFPNVAMPHVLWQLSGPGKLTEKQFESHEKALAAAIGIKGSRSLNRPPMENGSVNRRRRSRCARFAHGRVLPGVRRRPRQFHRIHGRAHEEQADQHRDRRAALPRPAIRSCTRKRATGRTCTSPRSPRTARAALVPFAPAAAQPLLSKRSAFSSAHKENHDDDPTPGRPTCSASCCIVPTRKAWISRSSTSTWTTSPRTWW